MAKKKAIGVKAAHAKMKARAARRKVRGGKSNFEGRDTHTSKGKKLS
jgi:hypothetical protein